MARPEPRAQALFERMADEWEGVLELVSWDRPGRAVLRATAPGLKGGAPGRRFRMSFAPAPYFPPGLSSTVELVLVRRLGRTPAGRWYPDGPEVYVSPVPSAVLAVGLR